MILFHCGKFLLKDHQMKWHFFLTSWHPVCKTVVEHFFRDIFSPIVAMENHEWKSYIFPYIFFFFLFAFELTYQASTYLKCNYSLLYLKNQSYLNFLPPLKATNYCWFFFRVIFSPIVALNFLATNYLRKKFFCRDRAIFYPIRFCPSQLC